jgi:hypothetical protein
MGQAGPLNRNAGCWWSWGHGWLKAAGAGSIHQRYRAEDRTSGYP